MQRFERGAPNQLWQMDFKGPVGWEAPVGPLSVLDDHSRYAIALARDLVDARRACAAAAERGFPTLRRARRNADGSRHAVVEHARGGGLDLVDRVADEARDPAAFQRISASADARKSGTIPRRDGRDDEAARISRAREQRQEWLDGFRQEYNHVRPHEALGMRTPATVWSKSVRAYQTASAGLGIPAGAEKD